MTSTGKSFRRVTKREPCPICGKPDWCMVAITGEVCICQRVDQGAEKHLGDAGWLHRLKDRPARIKPIRRQPQQQVSTVVDSRDWPLIVGDCVDAADGERVRLLGKSLGISCETMIRLETGWASKAMLASLGTKCSGEGCWTFPMFDAKHAVVGVRLRSLDGFKYAIAGSDGNGIFDPCMDNKADPLVIVEGPTSAGAMCDLGYSVIGRSSCTGSTAHCVARGEGRNVVIYADSDKADEHGRRPGRAGAEALAAAMKGRAKSIKIMQATGAKDVRAMVNDGADRDVFDILISQAAYWR